MTRSRRAFFSSFLVPLAVATIPLRTTACGQTACFTVTSKDLANGMCPDPTAALSRFSDMSCGSNNGDIEFVQGSGTLSDGMCCYSVVSNSSSDNVAVGGPECTTEGVSASFAVTTSVAAGPGGSMSTSTGFGGGGGSGGTGGTSSCNASAKCSDALSGAAPFPTVCGDPGKDLNTLKICGCASHCTEACDPTLCADNAPDDGCNACLQGDCASQLKSCQSN